MAKRSQRLRRQRRIERMKTKEQEAKMTKVVEDNSVVLERMKNVSSSCDTILQTINTIKTKEEAPTEEVPTNAAVIEPHFMSTEPVPEFEEEETKTQDLKTMYKRDLLKIARELGCTVKPSTSKANIIKAIQSMQ